MKDSEYTKAWDVAYKNLTKSNQFWNKYLQDLKNAKDLRVMSILSQVAIQWYVDRMLHYKLNTEIFERLRYEKKLDGLEELKIIDSNLKDKLNIIYDIRNIYAHEVDVKEKRIEDLLNKIKKIEYNSGMWKHYSMEKLF